MIVRILSAGVNPAAAADRVRLGAMHEGDRIAVSPSTTAGVPCHGEPFIPSHPVECKEGRP
jgi:hypothetical protein